MKRSIDYRHVLFALMAAILLAGTGWTQDAETAANDTSETAAEPDSSESAAATDDETVEEEIDVDDGSYLDAEDDDFKPSEEISADGSITFPTDI